MLEISMAKSPIRALTFGFIIALQFGEDKYDIIMGSCAPEQPAKFHGSVSVFLEDRINRALPAAFIGTKQFLGGRDAGFGNLK